MPSYRVALDVHGVPAGVEPPTVLPRAEELMARTHVVEDRSVEIVRGQPQLHLRFLVAASRDVREDDVAEEAVRLMARDLGAIAHLGRWTLRRGPGRHWRTVRSDRA
ncbi:hypothetical protein [Janibacter cremeus]|uniref:Uncharacterized protein n=1 Tax=Janibacter cremeus TaxID=1285192 RepID=A0A852VUE6_9MICO|nr:hypothetical protein [Janibacter cremeus]NYF99618.1 hypothetical protein [Janibacter cremeus]